ncbi:hypothetical protein [Liquorilactobacillus hordei]|uniref:hypothetical protein n=1 Tax=Liquorilactobacillus hordei TaxID=468911 RepID=UPI0039EBD7CD
MTIRLIIGQSKFKSGFTAMEKPYPFSVAAFIPSNWNDGNRNLAFRRVLGMIYGKKIAEKKLTKWKNSTTVGAKIVNLLKKDNVYLANICESEKEIVEFLEKATDEIKILALGDDAITFFYEERISLFLGKTSLYKYTLPTTNGNSQQLFEEFDYDYNKHYDSARKIIDEFTISKDN